MNWEFENGKKNQKKLIFRKIKRFKIYFSQKKCRPSKLKFFFNFFRIPRKDAICAFFISEERALYSVLGQITIFCFAIKTSNRSIFETFFWNYIHFELVNLNIEFKIEKS